jgi:hypothetical protein
MRRAWARQAWGYSMAGGLSMLMLLAGCSSTPIASGSMSDRRGIRLTAQLIAPALLAELLEDEQAAQQIVAVELNLQNVGTESLTIIPSRAALVGPRNQRIRSVEASALSASIAAVPRRSSIGTPPYVNPQEDSSGSLAMVAGQKALRPQVLAPGDASQGWLYFPLSGRRAAAEVSHRWLLAIVLQDREQRVREYLIGVEPPDESSG